MINVGELVTCQPLGVFGRKLTEEQRNLVMEWHKMRQEVAEVVSLEPGNKAKIKFLVSAVEELYVQLKPILGVEDGVELTRLKKATPLDIIKTKVKLAGEPSAGKDTEAIKEGWRS